MPRPDDDSEKTFWNQLARYSELAFLFPAATVAGLLIGIALDHWLHTKWMYLAGLVAGIIAGFVQLIRVVSSSDNG
jgi:F0F1-type ATP synthase assembly protein I